MNTTQTRSRYIHVGTRSKSLAGYGSSQSVGDMEEVIYVSLWVVLQQLDVGSEISNQEALPDKDEHGTAYPQQGVLYKNTGGIR